jgi:hypothetical protein
MISVLDMLQSRLRGADQPLSPVEEEMLRGWAGPSVPPPSEADRRLRALRGVGSELGTQSEADRRLRAMGPIPPSDLPEAVWDSLLNRPTYGEGSQMPGPPNPLMEQERAARLAPQRENDLDANVRYMDYLKRSGMWAMPEGAYGMRLGHEQQPAQPPFASPLNQLMIRPGSRVPAALY